VDLLRKDLGLALESAKVTKVPLFMTAQAYQYFTRATAEGLGKKDMSAVIELLEKTVGVQVRRKVKSLEIRMEQGKDGIRVQQDGES